MRALIIANGSHPRMHIIHRLLREAEIIICADGGANFARKNNIEPHVILGDFDSLTKGTIKYFKNVRMLPIKDQYSTDLEKAITFCLNEKINEADIIGASGDRLDHTTGSLGCFRKYRGTITLRMIDDVAVLSEIRKSITITARKGEKISLIPLGRCTGVTTKNLLYGLNNGVLEIGVQEGISNEATGNKVTITVKKGILLLYRFHNNNMKLAS